MNCVKSKRYELRNLFLSLHTITIERVSVHN